MNHRENRPFFFAICVWLSTLVIVPIAWYAMKRLVPYWGPDLQPQPAADDLRLLPMIYLIGLGCSFLILGVFYLGAKLLAKSQMPTLLVKAILSVLVVGLIRLVFFLIDAEFENWSLLLMFRCFYVVAILCIWIFPVRNKRRA